MTTQLHYLFTMFRVLNARIDIQNMLVGTDEGTSQAGAGKGASL